MLPKRYILDEGTRYERIIECTANGLPIISVQRKRQRNIASQLLNFNKNIKLNFQSDIIVMQPDKFSNFVPYADNFAPQMKTTDELFDKWKHSWAIELKPPKLIFKKDYSVPEIDKKV